jgi:hypothetical protein
MDGRIPRSNAEVRSRTRVLRPFARPAHVPFAARCAGFARFVALAAAIVAATVPSCRSRPSISVAPVGASASEAMSEAELHLRGSDPRERAAARELALHALELEPDWVAPERLLDDLRRDELRGIEALQDHRARLAAMDDRTPEKRLAGELYLAGRLEGLDGRARFENAVRLDPDLAWGYHGLSWVASVSGETREALKLARSALARARDSWERSFFTAALARALVAVDKREEASALLEERAAAEDTRLADRDALELQAVEIGLDAMTLRLRVRSYERALTLLRERELSESEIEGLVGRLRLAPSPDDPDSLALQSSLAVRRSPARDRLRAELMLDSAPTPLALALLQRGLEAENRVAPAGALMRAARFAAGEYATAIDVWLAELPRCVLDGARKPADPRLKRVVECAHNLGRDTAPISAARSSSSLAELAEALVAAGWFREARSVAGELAGQDLDRALSIESRAVAGQELIDDVRRLIRKVDLEQGGSAPASPADVDTYRIVKDGESGLRFELVGDRTGVHNLATLLTAMAPSFARAHTFLGGDLDADHVTRDLSHSPRMSYGPIGELVHPGPRFSTTDEDDDLGPAGESVPGLARELDRIGRFGLFGEVAGGGGPDGTLLPRIYVEHKSGAHLGVSWSGTVAWCESAELKSRAGRRGAHISAAALHEGYWVDIDAVRGERTVWNALRREFASPRLMHDVAKSESRTSAERDHAGADAEAVVAGNARAATTEVVPPAPESASDRAESPRERIARVLAVRGLALESSDPERRSRERTQSGFLLGEAQRVRLALLVERGEHDSESDRSAEMHANPGHANPMSSDAPNGTSAADRAPRLGEVGLDELIAVTTTHEEGHLCDRTRYLPLGKHVGPVFLFLLDCGFSPRKVTEMLEYRAQLTSLCDSPDPRVPLAQVLDAAEQGPSGITPHASGYAQLLSDLLEVFDDELTRHPTEFPGIDPGYTLAHQLHHLRAEEVRRLALRLAHKKRLSR